MTASALPPGIYAFAFHPAVAEFARQYLPQGKPVFFVDTYGGFRGSGPKAVAEIAREKGCPVLGSSTARVRHLWPLPAGGRIAKGRPNIRIWKTPAVFFGRSKLGFRETDRDEVC